MDDAGAPPASQRNPPSGEHDASADVMALGLASVLGPVVREFDARVEGALKSQSLLTGSIDRLTKGMVNRWICAVPVFDVLWSERVVEEVVRLKFTVFCPRAG
jgi:hypothetical protein